MDGGGGAASPSKAGLSQSAWGRTSTYAGCHGLSGVNIRESRPVEGGGGAAGPSEGGLC